MFMGEIIVNLYFFAEALEEKSRLFCPFFKFFCKLCMYYFFIMRWVIFDRLSQKVQSKRTSYYTWW